MKNFLKGLFFFCLFYSTILLQPAHADNIGLIMRGVAKTVGSAFQIPVSMMRSGTSSFPFGIVGGALSGTVKAVTGTISGATDMARGAAPYAKYMVFM